MNNHKILKAACYTSNLSMSVVCNLSPLLFLTFRTLYGISFSLLGALVLINFFTQLLVDLLFSFFSHKMNITLSVKIMPVLAAVGLIVYASVPVIFPSAVYLGLVIGTVIFSAASGLNEVLISPIIAEIPAENPDHEMSKLHSVYAWGVVAVAVVSTLFLLIFDDRKWQYLAYIFAAIPVVSAVLFSLCEIPEMKTPEKSSGALAFMKNRGVWICVLAIFLGGAVECTMAQWASGYLEQALGLPKALGDVFGVAMFAATLGFGRTLYTRIGKSPTGVVLWGAVGAAVCYAVAIFSPFPIVGLLACGATGFFASMLWPGNILISSDRYPEGGVIMYALMASGGDLGAALGPQLVGVIADFTSESSAMARLADALSVGTDVLGMKAGMLIGLLFALCAIPLYASFHRAARVKKETKKVN